MSLRALDNQDPVISLSFCGQNRLLAAAGSFLKLYDWRLGKLMLSKQIFEVNRVHGLTLYGEASAVAWGDDSVALVSDIEHLLVSKTYTCKDRVTNAAVFEGVLYLLTAHNEVLEIELKSLTCRKTHFCDERSILYSGSLYISKDKMHVASGTVFGGVVIWDMRNDKVVHALKAHEGSIFDVAWSEDGKRVVSCSDDRAVIVHDVETGKTIAQGWGHLSRIWKVEFVAPNTLLTAAEDCSARVWSVPEKGSELICTRILTGHSGKSVWSLGVERNDAVVATGGGDGKIMLWDLGTQEPAREERCNIESTIQASIRSIVLSKSTLIVACNDGRLYTKNVWAPDWTLQDVQLGAAPVIKKSPSRIFVFSFNGRGAVLSTEGEVVCEFSLPFTILDFFVLSDIKLLVVPAPPLDIMLVVTFHETDMSWSELVQKPGAGVITSACDISHIFPDNASHICLGTRNGCLLMYSEAKPSPVVVVTAALDSKTTAITSLGLVSHNNSDPHLIATARSSEYGVFSLPELQRLFKNRARKRGSIEGMYRADDELLFWGFQNDLFVVWNATHHYEMASTSCGGSHRAWDCTYTEKGLCFAYFRKPDIVVQRLFTRSTKFARSHIQPGTHGREIRGMELCPANPLLLATASEDTSMALSWLNEDRTMASTVCSINDSHVSGIQCLGWHPDGQYLFTGAGKGELVMWQVHIKGTCVFAKEASRMPIDRSHLDELRIMDISILTQDGNMLVAVAYSDSSYRVWKLYESDGQRSQIRWELLLQEKYGERCLLNIDLRHWCGALYLFFSSTDGNIVIQALKEEEGSLAMTSQLKLRQKLHQSGVRCSLLHETAPNSMLLCTGGEDNALSVIELVCKDGEITSEQVSCSKDAHASAVTSLAYLKNKNMLISTGSDQKVKLWAMNGEHVSSTYTDVCDTGVLLATEDRVITAGIGLEFFELIN